MVTIGLLHVQHNTTFSHTPDEVLFGRIGNIPGKLQRQPQTPYNFDDIVMEITQKCKTVSK
jgi:hypothetical protein